MAQLVYDTLTSLGALITQCLMTNVYFTIRVIQRGSKVVNGIALSATKSNTGVRYAGVLYAVIQSPIGHAVQCTMRVAEYASAPGLQFNKIAVPVWFAMLKSYANGAIAIKRSWLEVENDTSHAGLYAIAHCIFTALDGSKPRDIAIRVLLNFGTVKRLVLEHPSYTASIDTSVNYDESNILDALPEYSEA